MAIELDVCKRRANWAFMMHGGRRLSRNILILVLWRTATPNLAEAATPQNREIRE